MPGREPNHVFDDLEIDLQDKLESIFKFRFELVPYVEQYKDLIISLRGSISPLTGSGYALKPITLLLINLLNQS